MAVTLNSFTINGNNASFQNTTESYYDVLNGGETLDNQLQYTFTLGDTAGHRIESFTIYVLIFNSDGTLSETKPLTVSVYKNSQLIGSHSGNVISFTGTRTPYPIVINNSGTESQDVVLSIVVSSQNSVYFGLSGIQYSISDLLKDVKVSFSGPLINRTVSSITCTSLDIIKGATTVSFTKDPINDFNQNEDIINGRVYFRKNGIFVDGYQYGVNAEATTEVKGITKLSESSFETDNGGIVAPTESGVAATPQLVFNALATAKNYTDEQITPIQQFIGGINAPVIVNIDQDGEENISFGNTLTFSTDFKKEDNKLYINWLELI